MNRRKEKRLTISKIVGTVIQFIGVFITMLSLCTDLDVSADSDKAARFMIIGIVVGALIVVLGLIIEDTRRLKRRLFPAGIVVLALIYGVCNKAFGLLAYIAKQCYTFRQDCKHYKVSTYKAAQKKYDEFSKLNKY